MLDIHSHILPKMDDGSSSVEESLKLLRTSAEQGITEIAATPHFLAISICNHCAIPGLCTNTMSD